MVEQRRLSLDYQRQVGDPASLAMAQAYYGQVLGETGETRAAYQNLGDALTLIGEIDDVTEDERLYVMLNFGVSARRMGRLDEAEPLIQAVVARRREAGEPGALSFALSQLADIRMDQNQFAEAETLYLEALELVEGDAEAVSFIITDLGELWRFTGRVEEAETALRQVVDYTAERHGTGSLETAVPLRNLANHLDVTGRKARALDMLLQLGFVVARQGRYGDAIELLRGAVALTERSFGPDSREMINALQLLSYALYMDGQYEDTLEVLTRTERITDAQGARWPSTVVDVKGNLGRTYVEAGRPQEALPPLRQAVVLAARLTRDQATASGVRAEINRAPFRTLVDAAWDAAAIR